MIIIQNVFLDLDTDFSDINNLVSGILKISKENIISATLHRKSIDARKKDNIVFCCSFIVKLSNALEKNLIAKNKHVSAFFQKNYDWNRSGKCNKSPVIVGFGPAGMFAALLLARSGMNPIVLERGEDVDNRMKSVNDFFNGGKLNSESNIQFGEGGAGTFSDGKLNTGIKDFRCEEIIKTFVEFGANEKILYDAKPHIGTDVLVNVVKNIRNEIIKLGGKVLFSSKVTDILFDSKINGVIVNDSKFLETDNVILATGHSARDIFSLLKNKKVSIEKKPFAMGVRIEHLQSDINKALYGKFSNHPALEPAAYKLAVHLPNGRGVYTFCMCPGGEVVNASSESDGIAVNGMSNFARDGKNANSALLVGVLPEDLPDDVLSGCELQKNIENKAYSLADGKVPITTVGNLLKGIKQEITDIIPSVKPEYVFADLYDVLPEFIVNAIKQGLPLLDNKLEGFAKDSAIITMPETRSSSPVRIIRNENLECISVKGMYPCGEGAGYAGGIVSAAVDGLKCAERLIENSLL